MTVKEKLNAIAKERILVLDGAMGSLIQSQSLSEEDFRGDRFKNHPTPLKGCNDLLCLTRPEIISQIHEKYLEAGADIIETCSFNSTAVSLSEYGLGSLSYEISRAAAVIARNAADKFAANGRPRFVAGSIGPTAKGASLYPDINNPAKRSICWDELEAAYYENAKGLLDGGVDLFIIETVFDTLNAKAAFFAINKLLKERNADVPVIVSVAVSGESNDRLLSGQTLEAFCNAILPFEPWAIGLNCSLNAKKLIPFVRLLAEIVPCKICVCPNAGLPNSMGQYEETPQTMSANIEEYFKENLVNVIGGCCGSTPAHIKEIAQKVNSYKSRIPCETTKISAYYSGLELLKKENVNLENIINEKDKADFAECLSNGEYEDAVDIARDIIEAGAEILVVELEDSQTLNGFLDYALMNPYVAKVPFFIKSSCIKTIEEGLKRLQGRGVAGPVSKKEDIELIESYGSSPRVYDKK